MHEIVIALAPAPALALTTEPTLALAYPLARQDTLFARSQERGKCHGEDHVLRSKRHPRVCRHWCPWDHQDLRLEARLVPSASRRKKRRYPREARQQGVCVLGCRVLKKCRGRPWPNDQRGKDQRGKTDRYKAQGIIAVTRTSTAAKQLRRVPLQLCAQSNVQEVVYRDFA